MIDTIRTTWQALPRDALFLILFCKIIAFILNKQKFQAIKSNVSLKIRNAIIVLCSHSLSKLKSRYIVVSTLKFTEGKPVLQEC